MLTPKTVAAAPFSDVRERRAAIDVFFRSLAESHGDGFAIVLSGGGSDGSLGARAVKETGGVVLVQDPREATHEAMPRAVIAAELADIVAPVADLAARLVELVRHRRTLAPLIREPREAITESDEAVLRSFGAVTIHDSYAKRPLRLDDVRTARRLLREARLTLGSLDRQIAELDEKRNKLRGLLAR